MTGGDRVWLRHQSHGFVAYLKVTEFWLGSTLQGLTYSGQPRQHLLQEGQNVKPFQIPWANT